MLKKLKLLLYRNSFLREIFFLFGSRRSYHTEPYIEVFSKANAPYWKDQRSSGSNEYILVEGFLASYGINYLLRTGMVAKGLEEISGYTSLVLFDDYAFRTFQVEKAYRSFNIDRFLNLKNKFFLRALHSFTGFFIALFYFIKIRNGKELITLRYRNIHLGDLIYDDIIKNITEDYTVNTIKWKHFRFFREAFYDFGIYTGILKKYKIRYLVATHTQYIKYGLLARLAMYRDTEIFETNDVHLVHYKEFDKKNNLSIPSYLSGINEWIRSQLKTLDFTPEKLEWVDNFLGNRFKGNFNQLDINLAFKDKKTYNNEELKKLLNINNDNPMVFLLAHALSDAPHLSKFMIFKDYYDWMEHTLNIVKDIKNVNWIFKPHPSAKLFKEEGFIENFVASYNCDNFYITPIDFSTSSIKDLAKSILTTQGTAGLEFSCFGIPVIITGRPLYAECGFTIEPVSKEEYNHLLHNIATLEKLTPAQVLAAKKVYYLYEQYSLVANDLIQMEMLKKIWDYDEGSDKKLTYYEIAGNLNSYDPRDQRMYKRVKEYINS